MPRLLLINPRFPESFWSFRWLFGRVLTEKQSMSAPLGLATLAALCPSDWDVTIVDENIEPVPMHPDADLVGVAGMGVQRDRQLELLEHYRRQGYRTVVGGSYASLCPEDYAERADHVISGEAEYIWPRFLRELADGRAQPLYREEGEVDLADSPVPRFDLLQLDAYHGVPLQFSRGCPFKCEFCDIIVMFGRKPRTKTNAQVLAELEALRRLDVGFVFFTDDNFIGPGPRTESLLDEIIAFQERHGHPFRIGTEVSLDLAQRPRLLERFSRAGFEWVFVGIESDNLDALAETGKVQNLRGDPLESVRTLMRAGLDVYAGFIVGFDADTPETVARQLRFIIDSGVQVSLVNLLSAIPKTPLYERLEAEGRLRGDDARSIDMRLGTNVEPAAMTYSEMLEAYRALWAELSSDAAIAERVRNKAQTIQPVRQNQVYSRAYELRLAARILRRGILPGGPRRWRYFVQSLPYDDPQKLGYAIADWAKGLSTQDYVRRKIL